MWALRTAELQAFRSRFGHCRVPQAWKENKKLGAWVARVRNLKRCDKLEEEKEKELEELGTWLLEIFTRVTS